MLKRKGVNAILFLFITLATVFLASSVNNILIIGSGVDYYLDYANIPNSNIVVNSRKEKDDITSWLVKQKEDKTIDDFAYNELQLVSEKAIKVGKQLKTMDNKGASLFVGTQDVAYARVFDERGNPFQLDRNEIAISATLMKRNKLKIGDQVEFHEQGISKSFTIKVIAKDAAFGNEMVGMSRIVLNKEDLKDVQNDATMKTGMFYIACEDSNAFNKALDAKAFQSVIQVISKDTYKLVYSFDMIMAALLILIGVCLILIALLVLRFTLTFTMEEQYQEIGILKAIGLRNANIKKLYLIKYLAIVSVGSILGLCISIPVSIFMIQSVSENIIMASNTVNIGVNIACALGVILLVLVFCYLCTKKLNNVSAITAIHGGENGERYQKRKGLCFHRHMRLHVPLLLGCNDILSHVRRFMVLIITFCISIILITIPLNTLNTMTSDEMVEKFQLDPNSAIYVRQIEKQTEGSYDCIDKLEKGMQRVERELKEVGYDANLTSNVIYFFQIQRDDKSYRKLMTLQTVGNNVSFSTYAEGSAPKLENEIAVSSMVMEEEDWKIGDYIQVSIGGVSHRMVITGTYSDYMQLGESARLNPIVDTSKEIMFDYWSIMVDMKTEKTQIELKKELKQKLSNYDWVDAQTLVDQNVGGIQDTLKQLVLPMTLMLCFVIMLITLLMEKLFITREKSEIAMMKSVGFRYRTIAHWQLVRMSMVVITSMIVAIPLSLVCNQFVLKPIFAIMGADVTIQVDALQVYIVYPCILFVGIILATLIAIHGVKKIDIREMNNLE